MAVASAAKFQSSSPFHQDLKAKVDAYFLETGKGRKDQPRMYLKTGVIFAWFLASYLFLLLVAAGPLTLVLGCVSLALAMAGIGFSVQHDANHGGYSENRKVNRALAWSLDLIGGSSYIWSWKHNVFHHTHSNVVGLDADVEIEPLGRFAPSQRHRAVHRFQHFYIWALYGFLALKWHLVDDFLNVAYGHVGPQRMPRPRGKALAVFVAGKVLFFSWAFVVPMFFHPVLTVLLAYTLTAAVVGVVLSVVFQLAHCVEEAQFPAIPANNRFEADWATHQLQTTVDFAPHNALLTWYVGGLNFQVVHHLFPLVCHLHYPALAGIVAQTAQAHGLKYHSHPTFRSALGSHVRWMRRMGQPNPVDLGRAPGLAA